MLISIDMKKSEKVTASFRIKKELLDKFRKECKRNNIRQTAVIERAIIKAIDEMRGL